MTLKHLFFVFTISLSNSAYSTEDLQVLIDNINPYFTQLDYDTCLKHALAFKPKQEEKEKHKNILIKLYQERGEQKFISGDVKASVQDFEKVIELQPSRKPYHWQLGISYYLADQFKEGKDLFELHKKVNPNDVENAVWHFICNVKLVGFEAAQKALIPIQHDRRIPMMDIYELFSGRMQLSDFIKKIPEYKSIDSPQTTSLMYTYQYLGLFHEAAGNIKEAKDFTTLAIHTYKQYNRSHYMGDTAVTHAKARNW